MKQVVGLRMGVQKPPLDGTHSTRSCQSLAGNPVVPPALFPSHRSSQIRDPGMGEDVGEFQTPPEIAQSGTELNGFDRIAANRKVVILAAHRRNPQKHSQLVHQNCLLFGPCRFHTRSAFGRRGLGRVWQSLPVNLAIRVQRQALHHHKMRGDHVVGERPGDPTTQVLPGDRSGGDEPGDQFMGSSIFPGHHHRIFHFGVRSQSGLDLTQLDPESPDLHLIVVATDKDDLPSEIPASQIPRAIESRPRRRRIGIWHEFPGSQQGVIQVTPGQTRAPTAKLTDHSTGDWHPEAVQNVDLRLTDGLPNGDVMVMVPIHPIPGAEGRVFGWPVYVQQLQPWAFLSKGINVAH